MGAELLPTQLSTKRPKNRGTQLGWERASIRGKSVIEAESKQIESVQVAMGRKVQGDCRPSGLQETLDHWGRLLLASPPSDSLGHKKPGISAETPLTAVAHKQVRQQEYLKGLGSSEEAPHWPSRCIHTQSSSPPVGHLDRQPFPG